ncbi:MAG: hypothetical protein WCW16_03220 [Candidatus Magasanikbacteria bacterium]
MLNFFKIEEQTPFITRKIISIVTFFFLVTFVVSRLTVYLVLGHLMPNFFLTIDDVHIHHFIYGVVLLVVVGIYLLVKRPLSHTRSFFYSCAFYGIGLGLTFDEFGMWVHLKDNYWVRQSYDAVVVIFLFLLNIAYYHSIKKWLKKELSHVWRFFRFLLRRVFKIKQ